MSTVSYKRDYRVTGPENRRAQERGLATAEWYATPIPRQRMKELMKRRNGPAIRDTIIWLVLLIGTGILAYHFWGTWLAIPAFFIYGILYTTPGDSRWHECGHGTAFKTSWMNSAVYHLASFMIFRAPTPWRWSHTRHHTDTIIVGRDAEIFVPRPPITRAIVAEVFRVFGGPRELWKHVLHCFGRISQVEKEYAPRAEWKKCFLESRITILIYLGVIAACFYTHSILPAMFIGLPNFYGNIIVVLDTLAQHVGLYEDVLDHRLNTRTVYMNPMMRFLYWNMNYHMEHHMFPMVPYHALPKLHQEMKADVPEPYPNLFSALKDVLAAVGKMKRDPLYTTIRPLPPTANPYQFGPHPFGMKDWQGDPRAGKITQTATGA